MDTDLTDLRNFDTPLFPVVVAAQAALVAPGTMRMWFQRERVQLHTMDAIPDKRGLPRLLTWRTVLNLSAAAALVRKGVDVADAHAAAKEWTHLGEGQPSPHGNHRDPACLFQSPALTMLIHYAGGDARVIPVTAQGGIAFQFSDLFRGGPVPLAPTIVLLDKVEQYARGVCDGYLREGR